MSANDTRALARAMYAAYERRDFDRVADFLHDDIDWVIYAPMTVFAFAGARRGKAAVLEALAGIAADYVLDSYSVDILVVDGDRAAAMSDATFTQRSTGRKLRFRLANFLRFEDGRVIEFREFTNSFDIVEQALGHTLTVA